jgi:phospholipid transport system substrate-binding protein
VSLVAMSARPCRAAAVLALLAGLTTAVPAWAGPPTEALRGYIDRVFAVLDDPGMKASGQSTARDRVVRALAREALDYRESARRSLGPYWEARTLQEQGRFVELFTGLIERAYLARISYDGERVLYDAESVQGGDATVLARAIARTGSVTPVEFSLHRGADGRWRVVDVAFEGMSLVDNYRAQFNKIIRGSSYEELIARLEAKVPTGAQASTKSESTSSSP